MNSIYINEKAYIKFMKYIKDKGFEFNYCCGDINIWNDKINEVYTIDKNHIIVLGGDYNDDIEIIDGKDNLIVLRQTFYKSKKKINEVLIPSSYGVVAGDIEMTPIEPIDKPRISFCGSKYTHYTRELIFNKLLSSDKIICDFDFTETSCNGAADPDILSKIDRFNNSIKNSEFVICPRGYGNFSIRFYEALMSGRIPIVVDSDNELPFYRYCNWSKYCVLVDNIDNIVEKILDFHKNNNLVDVQKKCKEIYKELFLNNYEKLIHTEILYCIANIQKRNGLNILSIPITNFELGFINNETFNLHLRSCYDIKNPYILNLDIDKPFFIARGGGQEMEYSYKVHIQNRIFSDDFSNINLFYTNGCGIYFSDFKSMQKYSNDYLNAYLKCDAIGIMPKIMYDVSLDVNNWLINNNIKPILDINVIFEPYYYPERFPYDIYKYIFNNKKILLVTSHINSIKYQIENDNYNNVWNFKIFTNCTFEFIKPPVTNAGNHNNKDYKLHLDEFYDRLDKLDHNYDIALISAGGYDILIGEYIRFKYNKSVLVIAGALQLWFGVMGNRWKFMYNYTIEKTRQKYWINTLDCDKPLNYSCVDGNGAYY